MRVWTWHSDLLIVRGRVIVLIRELRHRCSPAILLLLVYLRQSRCVVHLIRVFKKHARPLHPHYADHLVIASAIQDHLLLLVILELIVWWGLGFISSLMSEHPIVAHGRDVCKEKVFILVDRLILPLSQMTLFIIRSLNCARSLSKEWILESLVLGWGHMRRLTGGFVYRRPMRIMYTVTVRVRYMHMPLHAHSKLVDLSFTRCFLFAYVWIWIRCVCASCLCDASSWTTLPQYVGWFGRRQGFPLRQSFPLVKLQQVLRLGLV